LSITSVALDAGREPKTPHLVMIGILLCSFFMMQSQKTFLEETFLKTTFDKF
jgi:hypothetical protein